MAEILSRSEVELLLSALTPNANAEETERISPDHSNGVVPVPDAGTPESALARAAVSFAEAIRHAVQQTLVEALGESGQLRRQMPRRESLRQFLESTPGDPVWLILEAEQSSGDLLLMFDRGFGTMLLQRLLGGEPKLGSEDVQRGWSELDWRLLKRIVRDSIRRLPAELGWSPANIESATALSSFSTWNEQSACWVETWDCRFGPLRGVLRLATPWEFVSRRAAAKPPSVTVSSEDGGTPNGEFVAVLAEVTLPASRLQELKIGDLVVSDQPAETAAIGLQDGGPVWRGQAGQADGRRAIRLTERIGSSTSPEMGISPVPEAPPTDGM